MIITKEEWNLELDTETGLVRRIKHARTDWRKGSHGNRQGHRAICINGKSQYVHRLMWEAAYGPIPKSFVIDHIDHNPENNRLSNLRLVSRSDNSTNRRPGLNNGIYPYGGKWSAIVKVKGKRAIVGTFNTEAEAVQAQQSYVQN